jgi:hypothetical protein
MLTEEPNSIKYGYASLPQARLSLSFKTKVTGIFGADRSNINGHPFSAIFEYSQWESIIESREVSGIGILFVKEYECSHSTQSVSS